MAVWRQIDALQAALGVDDGWTDRRRLGLLAQVSPELVHLLRDTGGEPAGRRWQPDEAEEEPISGLKGILAAAVLSLPMWGFVGLVYWLIW